jgi:hypothetical protein
VAADAGKGDEAVGAVEFSSTKNIAQGGEKMVYGFGRGLNRGGGAALGFRGASPPWPYVGRGRGGLPRCWHPGAFPINPALYSVQGATQYAPRMTREQELGFLKEEANAVKKHLEEVEARIKELEIKGK